MHINRFFFATIWDDDDDDDEEEEDDNEEEVDPEIARVKDEGEVSSGWSSRGGEEGLLLEEAEPAKKLQRQG